MTKLNFATFTCLLFAVGCFFSLFMPIENYTVAIAALVFSLLLALLFNVMNTKIETGWQEDVSAILRNTFGLGLLLLTVGVLGFWGFESVFNAINKTSSQALSSDKVLWIAGMNLLICYFVSVSKISELRNSGC